MRYPFVTGTRGLPLRDIPSALYEFLWGRWVDWMVEYSDGRFTAPRMDFEVGGESVSFEDVNKKELRLAELSRFFNQMAPPTL